MKIKKPLFFILLLIFGVTSSFAHSHENHKHDKTQNHESHHSDHETHNHDSAHSDHKAQDKTSKSINTADAKGIVKEASIKGMVCAFCVDNIQKVFKKHKEVKDIHIDLDTKLLTLVFKEGQNMADKKIKQLIKSSGYDVVSIVKKR